MQIDISILKQPPRPYIDYLRSIKPNWTTKYCRKCGSTDLIEMRSLERKRCANCRRLIYWPLTEGQKPLL